MSTQQAKLDILLKWFDDNKIEWDKSSLEIKETNGSFGVFAKKDMKKDKPGMVQWNLTESCNDLGSNVILY